jgi:DNA-binding transcriptional ArsR family regulator
MVVAMTEPRRITDPGVLKALSHPLRRQIYRLLTQLGPQTVTLLTEHTGADPGQLSFHLRELAKRGFIAEAPGLARDRREHWWQVEPGSWSWSTEDFKDPAARAIADTAKQLMVAEELDRLRAYEARKDSLSPDWINAAVSSESSLRLRPDELQQLAAELQEVLARWSGPGRVDPPVRPEEMPADGRQPVFLFLHAFPEQP